MDFCLLLFCNELLKCKLKSKTYIHTHTRSVWHAVISVITAASITIKISHTQHLRQFFFDEITIQFFYIHILISLRKWREQTTGIKCVNRVFPFKSVAAIKFDRFQQILYFCSGVFFVAFVLFFSSIARPNEPYWDVVISVTRLNHVMFCYFCLKRILFYVYSYYTSFVWNLCFFFSIRLFCLCSTRRCLFVCLVRSHSFPYAATTAIAATVEFIFLSFFCRVCCSKESTELSVYIMIQCLFLFQFYCSLIHSYSRTHAPWMCVWVCVWAWVSVCAVEVTGFLCRFFGYVHWIESFPCSIDGTFSK